MRVALGIPCWQDSRAMIEATVGSCEGLADVLIVADGLIGGVDPCGLPERSDGFGWLPPDAIVESRWWPSQGAKRDWILQTARRQGCDWLVQLDTDERLHEPETLRAWLRSWRRGVFPLPFEHDRARWPGWLIGASWKCVRVADWLEVVAQGAYLRGMRDGKVYCLVPPEGRLPAGWLPGLPWVSHHPEERDGVRETIRLSELEDRLEPPAAIEGGWEPYPTPGYDAKPALAGERPGWFCDQCGRRYVSPGLCRMEHPAAVTRRMDDDTNCRVFDMLPAGVARTVFV